MTNDECQKHGSCRSLFRHWALGIGHSFVIRHSSFVIAMLLLVGSVAAQIAGPAPGSEAGHAPGTAAGTAPPSPQPAAETCRKSDQCDLYCGGTGQNAAVVNEFHCPFGFSQLRRLKPKRLRNTDQYGALPRAARAFGAACPGLSYFALSALLPLRGGNARREKAAWLNKCHGYR